MEWSQKTQIELFKETRPLLDLVKSYDFLPGLVDVHLRRYQANQVEDLLRLWKSGLGAKQLLESATEASYSSLEIQNLSRYLWNVQKEWDESGLEVGKKEIRLVIKVVVFCLTLLILFILAANGFERGGLKLSWYLIAILGSILGAVLVWLVSQAETFIVGHFEKPRWPQGLYPFEAYDHDASANSPDLRG